MESEVSPRPGSKRRRGTTVLITQEFLERVSALRDSSGLTWDQFRAECKVSRQRFNAWLNTKGEIFARVSVVKTICLWIKRRSDYKLHELGLPPETCVKIQTLIDASSNRPDDSGYRTVELDIIRDTIRTFAQVLTQLGEALQELAAVQPSSFTMTQQEDRDERGK